MVNRYCDIAALVLLGGLLLLFQSPTNLLYYLMVSGGVSWLLINCGIDRDKQQQIDKDSGSE